MERQGPPKKDRPNGWSKLLDSSHPPSLPHQLALLVVLMKPRIDLHFAEPARSGASEKKERFRRPQVSR